MSLIKNLVKEPEKKPSKKSDGGSEDTESKDEKVLVLPVIKTATDLQRLKLEKLMKDPQKPVIIAESRREKDYMASVPTFVRNVMGSSAGAGSGEFHVYRHLRRKEYARQKIIQAKSAREEADEAYQQKIEENRRIAEEKTAKKRAKRLKKKQRAKKSRPVNNQQSNQEEHNSTDSESNEEDATTSNIEHKKDEDKPLTDPQDSDKQANNVNTCENDSTKSDSANEEKAVNNL